MLHAILFSLATPPSAPPPSPDAPSCLSTETQAVWLQRANDGTTDYPAAQYVILSLYLLLLLGLVVAARLIALRRNEQNEAEHSLAGRSLGPITLGFSVCASMFSGYTVVGIPAEAYTAGFCQLKGISSRSLVPVMPCITNSSAASTDAVTCKRRRRTRRRIPGRAAKENNISPVTATPAQ